MQFFSKIQTDFGFLQCLFLERLKEFRVYSSVLISKIEIVSGSPSFFKEAEIIWIFPSVFFRQAEGPPVSFFRETEGVLGSSVASFF